MMIPEPDTFVKALDRQEATETLYDEDGETTSSKMQDLLDEWHALHPDGKLTGSCSNWRDLRNLAEAMDAAE